MKHLRVNDKVMVAEGGFEHVYSFGHRDEQVETTFLRFLPSNLELSASHMVFVQGSGPVPASFVKIGDRFVEGGMVEDIQSVKRRGLFTPFTPSGTIIVNGVRASTYISFQESDRLLLGSVKTPLTYQWLDHSFQAIHRIAVCWLGFTDETVENGFSAWSELPFKVGVWFLKQYPVFMSVLLVPFVAFLFVLNIVEFSVLNPGAFTTLVVVVSAVCVTANRWVGNSMMSCDVGKMLKLSD